MDNKSDKSDNSNIVSIAGSYVNIETEEERNIRCKKNERLRQKQIDIFYRTGRPIFKINKDTEHLRSFREPFFFVEKEVWET